MRQITKVVQDALYSENVSFCMLHFQKQNMAWLVLSLGLHVFYQCTVCMCRCRPFMRSRPSRYVALRSQNFQGVFPMPRQVMKSCQLQTVQQQGYSRRREEDYNFGVIHSFKFGVQLLKCERNAPLPLSGLSGLSRANGVSLLHSHSPSRKETPAGAFRGQLGSQSQPTQDVPHTSATKSKALQDDSARTPLQILKAGC